MGVYYLVHCPQKRELLDPGRVGMGGIKFYALVQGRVANLAMFAVISGRWPSFEVMHDCGDEYEEICDTHVDVTEELVAAFNESFSDPDDRIPLFQIPEEP